MITPKTLTDYPFGVQEGSSSTKGCIVMVPRDPGRRPCGIAEIYQKNGIETSSLSALRDPTALCIS